jgi:gamma-glutamyltranspeptidase/glutathione hydrolase
MVDAQCRSVKGAIVRYTMIIALLVVALVASALPAAAGRRGEPPRRDPVAEGRGGAVSTVDPVATEAGLEMLRRGGNAIDAAVAAAATLGVTEPYSSGIGGGGFMVVHLAETGDVVTIDGREEAPDDPRFDADVFVDNTADFSDAVNSGLSVGTPGTLATWVEALDEYGTMPLSKTLRPAIRAAQRGFVVDETYAAQTEANLDRFRQISSTAETFLVDGEVPAVGSRVRNRDLADTYRLLARRGPNAFYRGPLAREIERTVADPPTTAAATEEWQPGFLDRADLATYEVLRPDPTVSDYRGYDIYGMPSPSSGGITVGEALNIVENTKLSGQDPVDVFHLVMEATAHAFADRNAYIGDDRFVYVPRTGLLSDEFAAERWEQIDAQEASDKPVPPGDPCDEDGSDDCEPDPDAVDGAGGTSTTHLVTSDRAGNMVSYTLTIEQTGGSAITVPDRGFLLNNELTDFNFTGPSPNLAAPGKRPRSSMSPTIVLDDGKPFLAVGSPGGSTIITTVAHVLANFIDRDLSLLEAVAEPRPSQRNTPDVTAEPEFIEQYGDALEARGHTFAPFTDPAGIGAVTAIQRSGHGRWRAVAEPVRRGGGDAGVTGSRHRRHHTSGKHGHP